MSRGDQVAQANLDFFERELHPNLFVRQLLEEHSILSWIFSGPGGISSWAKYGRGALIAKLSVSYGLELPLWLRLGAGIGFFNKTQASDLIERWRNEPPAAPEVEAPADVRRRLDLPYLISLGDPRIRTGLVNGDVDKRV